MPRTFEEVADPFLMKRGPFIGNGIRNINNTFVSLRKSGRSRSARKLV